MNINPKIPQHFEKLKHDFHQLAEHPDKKQLEQFKGELKQFIQEIDNLCK